MSYITALWENWTSGTEDNWKIMTCKLIIKVNTKISVQGFTAMRLIFLTQGDQMIGDTRHSQEVTSDCFIFFCTSLNV